MIEVLDKGFVDLYQHVGGDLSVVNGARVSYGAFHTTIDPSDEKLITYLLKNHHTSPFEHNYFTFIVKCPIFVAREWMRHRIGSFNEISGRYVQLAPEFYIPKPKDIRKRVGKPGRYVYEPAEESLAIDVEATIEDAQLKAYNEYGWLLKEGVAPEQARLVLPVSIYTQFFWSVNAHSLMNFLKLRTATTAQWEIQQFAHAVETYFADQMPLTHGAYLVYWK